jgi:NTE family protein
LEREGFHPQAVAGTSYGGLVAALYALGHSPSEIEDMFALVDQSRLYGRPKGSASSLLGLVGARAWLERTIGTRTFSELRIPCALTAADLESGREIILSKGRLLDAVLATIALPGLFPVVSLDGLELVDGGVVDPVPVAVARSLAPKMPVVAVVLSLPEGAPARHLPFPVPRRLPRVIIDRLVQTRFARVFDVFMRSVDIGSRQLAELRLRLESPDVIIRPAVDDIELLDRVDVRAVARLGEEAVKAAMPDLLRLMPWPRRVTRRLARRSR